MLVQLWKYGEPDNRITYDTEDGCIWCHAGGDTRIATGEVGIIYMTDGTNYAKVHVTMIGPWKMVTCCPVSEEYVQSELLRS